MTFVVTAVWLAVYDEVYIALQVPAAAASLVLVLAALLAFAAQAHGKLLRRLFSHRSQASHSERTQRGNSALGRWLAVAMPSVALLIVISTASSMRYLVDLRVLQYQPHFNVLGAETEVDIAPGRDVVIMLVTTVIIWAVGVLLTYVSRPRNE
jgi:hypothetical protein